MAVAAISLLVAACGGGGGGGAGPAVQAPAPTTAPTPATPTPSPTPSPAQLYALQLTLGPATYAQNTVQAGVFQELNALRGAGGYGYLRQSAALDAAAQGHAQYLALELINTGFMTSNHNQVAGRAGFTGATWIDRARVAGYLLGSVTEVIGGLPASLPDGGAYVRGMLNTVYHAQALQGGWREMGVGVARDTRYNQDIVVVVFGLPMGAWPQLPSEGETRVYPIPGQTGVIPLFTIANENPRPLPELTQSGHPIFFSVENQGELSTTAAMVKVEEFDLRDGNGNLVPSLIMTAPGTLVAPGLAARHRADSMVGVKNAYLVPISPLIGNVTYSVTARFTVGARVYTRTWSFTTRSS